MKKYAFLFALVSSLACAHDASSHIEAKIALIQQAKQAILLELRDTLVLGRKATFAIKKSLGNDYPALKTQLKNIVDYVIHSNEFISMLDEVTNYQVNSICEQEIAFKDIAYTYSDALIRKIDTELAAAFPELNERINTFFNILYVTIANSRACQLLLDKLEKEARKLKKVLTQINNQDQNSDK